MTVERYVSVTCRFSRDAHDSTSDHLDKNSATLSVCRYCCQGLSELCLTLTITHTLQPRASDTISYPDKWKLSEPLPLRTPSSKVWEPRSEPPPLRTPSSKVWKPRSEPPPIRTPTSKVWKPRPEPPLRTNQKSYLEGRGREHVPSKVLLQQSANTPLSIKKASLVPKLVKARRMDVFIPSTLSVAALAKLLNIKLGTSPLV